MLTRKQLRKKIPHGYFKIIAEKAGVTPKSVSCFFSGETKNSEKIETAALEVLAEIGNRRKELLDQVI